MLDALSLAVWSALGTTLIPKLIVSGEGEEMEIEVSDNPHDSTRIDVTKAPLIITLTQVRSIYFIDVTKAPLIITFKKYVYIIQGERKLIVATLKLHVHVVPFPVNCY